MAPIPEHAQAGQWEPKQRSKMSIRRAKKQSTKPEELIVKKWNERQTRLYNSFLRLAHKTYVRIPCDYYG